MHNIINHINGMNESVTTSSMQQLKIGILSLNITT